MDEVNNNDYEKSVEVKMVRANLLEEVVRIQKMQKQNEDELRKDYDELMVKYNEAIKTLQDTVKKSDKDQKMLKQKIEDIIEENKKVENDFTYQIN